MTAGAKKTTPAPPGEDLVALAELPGDPQNAREMPLEAAAGLGASVEEYGDLSGFVFNLETRELVTAHQRRDQLVAAGATHFVVTARDDRGDPAEGYVQHPKTGERFRIRFVRWTRERQREANLVANNPHIQGRFTKAALDQVVGVAAERLRKMRLDLLERDLDKEAQRAVKDATERKALAPPAAQWLVLVTCKDEAHQRELLERCTKEGLQVRAMVS